MMFAVSSYRSVGCTFLDWSLHYLAGQTNFYNVKQGWIPLAPNPLTGVNAHGHMKNHPRGFDATKKYLENLLSVDSLTSVYPTPLAVAEVAPLLNMDLTSVSQDQWILINEYIDQDFVNTLKLITDCGHKLIYVDAHKDINLYLIQPRALEGSITKLPDGKTVLDMDTIREDYQQFFFAQSIQNWQTQRLTNTWDERERQALCIRPFESKNFTVGFESPHLWFDCRTLWTDGEQVVSCCLDYLKLPMAQDRLSHWKSVYESWKQSQSKAIRFNFDCQRIVDSIVNNWWMEIDLSFEQEVVIQHCLIYQHNLNLKTWQLEKFPNNTQDLHKLLEPNIHPVPDIYQ